MIDTDPVDIPQVMKAVQFNRFGENPHEILEYREDVPVPVISKSEVLVKVKACSVNPVDWKIMKGNLEIAINKFPITPCFDVAGIVVQVGEKCKRLKVGMNVYGMAKALGNRCCGAAAEYMAISERCLAMMPRNLDYIDAASFPLVALTTYQCCAKVFLDSTKVLILGGSGGVGSFGIQYAKARGCFVAATCSERNVLLLQELGCDQIINYQTENWEEVLNNMEYDVIFDCVGGIDSWKKAPKVLKKNGYYVTIAGDVQDKLTPARLIDIAANYVGRNIKSLVGDTPKYSYPTCDGSKGSTQLLEIRHLIEGGFIKAVLDRESNVFHLHNLSDAFEYSMSGRVVGKVVVIVDETKEEFNNEEEIDDLEDLH